MGLPLGGMPHCLCLTRWRVSCASVNFPSAVRILVFLPTPHNLSGITD
jgi:hypothetical protein